ncbi:LTXXQ motif protein [Polystyrenella longa]|uniref:LTXXQ motif protein n=1 Tax=Polystyrenella longa TaxID=2528007 RepID=A0A518CH41_9PLAN|nr:Spy/CpxP family protein refolding chaperone [Polystyrenella longa]QDU78542.1 LTXXQ motif protein [Polystyrenella longa]
MSKKVIWTAVLGSACVFGIVGIKHMQAEVGETISTMKAVGELKGTLSQDAGFLFLLADASSEEPHFKGEGGGGGKFHERRQGRFPFMKGPMGEDFRKMMGGNIGRLMVLRSEIDLTDDQRQDMKKIFKNNRPEIQEKIGGLVEARMALVDQVLADAATDEEIKASAEKLGDAIGEMALLARNLKGEAKKVLTEEQQTKIRAVIDENRSVRREFHEKVKQEKIQEADE